MKWIDKKNPIILLPITCTCMTTVIFPTSTVTVIENNIITCSGQKNEKEKEHNSYMYCCRNFGNKKKQSWQTKIPAS